MKQTYSHKIYPICPYWLHTGGKRGCASSPEGFFALITPVHTEKAVQGFLLVAAPPPFSWDLEQVPTAP